MFAFLLNGKGFSLTAFTTHYITFLYAVNQATYLDNC